MTRGKIHRDNLSTHIIANSQVHALRDELIGRALAPFGIETSPTLAAAIRQYAELLLRWNEKISLTSITDPHEILQRHFGESMFAARAIPIVRGRLVDIGSGAGFPGLALKLISPELDVLLIEANVKKFTFLAEVVRTLGLKGVKVISKRIGDVSDLTGVAEYVTCRAVRPDKRVLAWARNALAPRGRCILWLGADGAEALRKNTEWEWQPSITVPLSTNRVILSGQSK